MIAVTLRSQACWLVTESPDWNTAPKLKPRKLTTVDASRTGRVGRRPLAAAIRCALEWTALLTMPQASALRDATQLELAEPVLVPCWPLSLAGTRWNAATNVGSNLLIAWQRNWTSYQIFDLANGDIITASAWDNVAPLLWGYFSAKPTPQAIAGQGLSVKFSFDEDGPADCAIIPAPNFPVVTAPALGAFSPAAFPFALDWSGPVKSGLATAQISREDVGPGRRKLTICYPQNPERGLEGTMFLSSPAEIGAMLAWWHAQNADAGTQWVSTWLSPARITANAAAGATKLAVDDAAQLGTNRYLALVTGTVVEYVKISSISGNILTLAAALQHPCIVSGTRLSLAMLAQHASNDLTLTFKSPTVANVVFSWAELSQEYVLPAGETRGQTIGALPGEAWFYEFEVDYGGASEFHRATSYEQDLTASGYTWTSRLIDHGNMVRSLDPDDQTLDLTAEWWDGGPFEQAKPGNLEASVILRVYRGTVSGSAGSGLKQMWEGIVRADYDGPKISGTVTGPNRYFKMQLPGDTFGPSCNAQLYDRRCNLLRAAWQFSAVVTAISGYTITIGSITRTGGLPAGFGFVDWFGLGFLESNIGGLGRRWSIYHSTVLASAAITLTLRKPYNGTVGDSIALWPGCDKRRESCRAYNADTNPQGKFDNYANNRGFYFVPDRAPQFQAPKTSNASSGKK